MTDLPPPPRARRVAVVRELHGERVEDPYAWLRDPRWREVMRDPGALSGEIRRHLEAENAYSAAVLAGVGDLRARLVAEMRGRIKDDDRSVPAPDGPYAYYVRYAPGGEHPRFCRRPRGADETDDRLEQVLLDGDLEARGLDYFRIGACEHAPDHALLAWAADTNGSEIYTIRLRDPARGADLEDRIEGASGSLAWALDGRTLLYVTLDESHRPSRVLSHRVGDPPGRDRLVYEEPDPGFFVGVHATQSRRHLVIDAHDHTTSEIRLVDAAHPDAAPRLVAARERDHRYEVDHRPGRLVILSNSGGAEDFRLLEAPEGSPGREHWREIVPHRPGVLVTDFLALARHLVRLEREDGQPRIVVRRWADGAEHPIAFDEEAYALGLDPGYEFDTSTLRFTYASPTTPRRTFDYDLERRLRVLRKEQEVPSGHDPGAYRARRLFATSHDGERVPITLLHHADHPPGPRTPLLLYGYGAYGHAIPAGFSTDRLSLVDRGVGFAIAHVRGGTERGWRWYREGRGMAKRNTFADFVAAAEHLIAEQLASPARLACHGASAGGLTIGAVLNERPDLFRAAVGEVPFVDVLNTMCDADLPLTPPEWPEWGNPLEDPEAFRYIRSYSPYDNVRAQAYPDVLATAGLTDPRVTYWEPAKWVARLRAERTDAGLTLLHTEMGAGHGGPAGRFQRLEETALVQAFVLRALGLV